MLVTWLYTSFCLVDVSEDKSHIEIHIKLEGNCLHLQHANKMFLSQTIGNVGLFVCTSSPLRISLDQLSLATSH